MPKTHSLIASWHMFSGAPAGELAGADEVLKHAEAGGLPKANRAVFVGTRVSPGMVHKKDNGTVVRTLWGEIAWQLGGKKGYEIVRAADESGTNPGDPALFTARDAVARGFVDMYRAQSQEFPSGCREAEYERRIQAAYPVHPELFDRLYEDWASLERFQRTRGVLKLMAAVIHELWERQDSNLLIMPATVPIDAAPVRDNLTEYLEENWSPVIEKDIDGPHSLPLRLDRENPNLGRYSATRRVARSLFLGSAATSKAAHRGLEDVRIKLGCVQPGESVATFGDGLRRLTDSATHLYQDGRRYWYSTQPSVSTLARDRAAQQDEHAVFEEIKKRLRNEARSPGDFVKVHPCLSSADIPDEADARLVILGPEYTHASKSDQSPARREAAMILDNRGSSPRNYRNALIFLAADRTRLGDLDQAVRQFLGWRSIEADHETLNLDAFSRRLAETKRQQSDETVDQRIPECFCWVLLPVQQDPKGSIEWREIRMQGDEKLALRASKKLKNEGLLAVQYGATLLRKDLDDIPLWRGPHVSIDQLTEDYAKYVYLSRLKNRDVVIQGVRDGLGLVTWASETFAYADGWDESRKRYRGLRGGQIANVSDDGLLVRPDVASAQLADETPAISQAAKSNGAKAVTGIDASPRDGVGLPVEGQPTVMRRFHGSVILDPNRIGRDAGKIAEEVLQHLTTLIGTEARVALELQVTIPDGVPDHLLRVISENCRTLRFESYGFEPT